jgi:secreted Zn-dependent insulinase-like peptidase
MLERPYSPEFYNKIYKMFPVQDRKNLQISWTLSDKSQYYKNPPSSYISHIIGHEGKGSLLEFLIEEGLATALAAGGSDFY